MGEQQFANRAPLVNRFAGEQLVENQPQRIQIALNRRLTEPHLFGRHVGRRAGDLPFPGVIHRLRQTEVGDPHASPSVQHDVGRLQVAMQHPHLVSGGKSGAQLLGDLDALVPRQPADPLQENLEILTVDVFHRQKMLSVDLADVVHPADVGVADLPRQPNLVVEEFQSLGILGEVLRKKLQRHRVAELEVVRPVNFAHPPLADQRDDTVTLGDLRPRQKSTVLRSLGKRRVNAAVVGAASDVYLEKRRRVLRPQRSPALRAETARLRVVGGTGRTRIHGKEILASSNAAVSSLSEIAALARPSSPQIDHASCVGRTSLSSSNTSAAPRPIQDRPFHVKRPSALCAGLRPRTQV